MNRPRILHLIHHLRPGGAERLLADLLPRLAEAGFDVHVACLIARGPLLDELEQRGIPGHFIGRRRGLDLSALRRLRGLWQDLRVDILNTHAYSAGFWGRLAAGGPRAPLVVTTEHSVAGWSQPLKQRIAHALLRHRTDCIVAVSESVRQSFLCRGAPPRLVRVIPNGICLERFAAATDRAEERKRLRLPADRFLVGLVARCVAVKGGEHWVRAVSLLHRERRDVHGVLVGAGADMAGWQALSRDLGIAECVTFAGERMDVPRWLSVFDVLVCPSIQESFGLSALEAQASGVPVVATRVDGFLDTLHDGEDALLVPPGDAVALFDAVRRLKQSPELAARLVAGGRLNAVRFGIERTADRYAALYRELLARPRGRARRVPPPA